MNWPGSTEYFARLRCAIRLDYTKLKQHTQAAPVRKTAIGASRSFFVELMTSASPQGCECIIEVEGPRGRMRTSNGKARQRRTWLD